MPNIINIHKLSHQFENSHWGLKDITLSLAEGQFITLSGANGSGKTLLMRHLVGLELPTEGYITYKNQNIHKDIKTVRQAIGIVFQNPDHQIVAPFLEEEVAFGLRNRKEKKEVIPKKVEKALHQVGLSHKKDRNTQFLSGGEKKRLTLASVLVMDPEVIILDEPFTGLDYSGVGELLRILQQLKEEGRTILIISHDLEKFLALSDRLIILHQGRLVYDEPLETLPDLRQWDIHPPYDYHIRPKESLSWLD
ncbi:energy-coupling factor ABC transporter ATP-binding protein [Spirochaeta cellobiosiphila]|uniref:energy-coupling factor ABC transporter ATP-binding protein n=1 Tax=Spirochaeta cellobiosiphila TaxID=504483 RepID=UPI0004296A64|nr:ABC transporter ATP-binding protein [Spirochaeta cellobiosiphila]